MIYQLFQQMKAGKRPRIFTDGEQRRDFVYVKDVVEATILSLMAPDARIYNVGSGESASFNQMVAALNRSLGTQLEAEYFENPYPFYQNFTQADISLAQKELNYQPAFNLDRGISDYVDWLQKETSS